MNKINHPHPEQHLQLSSKINSKDIASKQPTIIGKINPIQTLNCHISPPSLEHYTHKFTINYKPINSLTELFKKRVRTAFDKIAAITYQLKINSTNVFIPQALLSGNTQVMRQYKKLLESTRIGAYIRLNLRKQQFSREKKAYAREQQSKKKAVSIQHSNQRITFNSIQNQYLQNPQQQPSFKSNALTSFSQQQINIEQTLHYTHRKEKRSQRLSHCKSKKNSDNGSLGITINYYEVNRSNKKDNPQIKTYIYQNKASNSNLLSKSVLLNNGGSSKSVRQKNHHNQRVRKNSTTKTQIINVDHFTKSTLKQNQYNISKSQLSTIRPNRVVSSYLTEESLFKNPQDSINQKMIVNDGFITERKGQYQPLFCDEIMTGKGLVMGGKQRNIGKRKAKQHENIFINAFE